MRGAPTRVVAVVLVCLILPLITCAFVDDLAAWTAFSLAARDHGHARAAIVDKHDATLYRISLILLNLVRWGSAEPPEESISG